MKPSPLPPGNAAPTIPGYRLLEKLPDSHSADLYLAQQDTFDRQVVIKIASATDAKAPPADAAPNLGLVHEAQISARLNHPHIIRVFDVGEHNGQRYLAMEYLEGGDLKQRLRYDMTTERALTIAKQLASAMDAVHRQGYVHGNLTPDHILLDKYDKAILSNFSQARTTGSEQAEQTGLALRSGPPQYLSPEQIRGNVLDGRSDFYRLGIVLYEMLMGAPPFDHPDVTSLSMMILNAPVPRIAQPLAPLQPLLDGLLSKDIATRCASGRELIADIEKLQGAVANQRVQRKRPLPALPANSVSTITAPVLHDIAPHPSSVRRRTAPPHHRARRRWPALALASVVLLGAGIYYLNSSGRLQQWADYGAASPNPQARVLGRQLQALLPGPGEANARFADTATEPARQALVISSATLGSAVSSQLPPGRIDTSMLATGAAHALSDVEAKH